MVVRQQSFSEQKNRYALWRRCAMDALQEMTRKLDPAALFGHIGYQIYFNGMLKMACFPEDADLCSQIWDEICSLCRDYKEREWNMPPRHRVPDKVWEAFDAVRRNEEFLQNLKQQFELAFVPQWRASSLQLCGRSAHVDAAFRSLDTLDCKLDVRTDHSSNLLSSKRLHSDAPRLRHAKSARVGCSWCF